MTSDLGRVHAAVFVLLAAVTPGAGAAELLNTPEAVRVCLCLDQAVTALSAELNQESDAYDAERKALAALESQVNAARQQLDPANAAQRNALSRLLDEHDTAVRRFAVDATPHYNAIVGRYNDAASAFNRTCGDKAYDWDVLVKVQDTLTCPAGASPQSLRRQGRRAP